MTANPMNNTRMLHTATLLPSGQVLVVGGYVGVGSSPTSSAELFNPNTETWTATATPLNMARAEHTATLLPDGTVLVAGGYSDYEYAGAMASVEVYNPATGIWTLTNQMNSARGDFTATTLTNGDVLVTGGFDDPSSPLSSTELYGHNSTALNLSGTMLEPTGAFQVSFATFPTARTQFWPPPTWRCRCQTGHPSVPPPSSRPVCLSSLTRTPSTTPVDFIAPQGHRKSAMAELLIPPVQFRYRRASSSTTDGAIRDELFDEGEQDSTAVLLFLETIHL